MANTKRPPSDPPGGRRRPPPVSNLEATEVSVSSSESPSKADELKPDDHTNPDNPAPHQQAADASPSRETAAEAEPSKPQPSEPEQAAAEAAPAAPPAPGNPPRQSSLPIVAGLSALGGGAVLFVLLWLSGAVSIGQQ